MNTTNTESKRGTCKCKIIDVAIDLFYNQGYNATGIQQIIDKAGVSKGTFYTHFKSKDELGVEYMRKRHTNEISELREMLGKIKDPYEKYLQFIPLMREWMKSTDYRGCAFANMAAEVTDRKSPIRKEARYHYEVFRTVIREMVNDLLNSDKKYKGIDPQFTADQLMLIIIGALTNAGIYQETWPFDLAQKSICCLIGEKGP